MNEEQIEDALHNWPMAEVPAKFSAGVMERIAPQQSHTRILQKSDVKFQLTWMDVALGIFFSFIPVLGFVAVMSLPQRFILYLEYQWLLLQSPAFEPVLFALVGTIAMLFLLAIVLALRSIFPRQILPF
jgi:hypothetical protein